MSDAARQHDPGHERARPADGAGNDGAGVDGDGVDGDGAGVGGGGAGRSAAARGGRSPWTWAGVALILVGLALGGIRRSFPFEPEGLLGHWFVQTAMVIAAIAALVIGVWMVVRGYRGRATGDDVAESLRVGGYAD